MESGSKGAGSAVQTSRKTAARHVEPREENRFVLLTALFSLSVQRRQSGWIMEEMLQYDYLNRAFATKLTNDLIENKEW